MGQPLKSKILHGLLWSFFELMGRQGIQFIIQIVLARLLAPEEFGLIAMLTIFMAVAQSIIDSGFGSALIQKQDASHLDECSIFYFNILVGAGATGILWFAAPWIAAFYKTPILTPLTRALSINLLINSFGLIQTALLTKRIDFKSQTKISLIATFFSGAIGIGMALCGFGVWSLVAQSLCSNLFRTVLFWFMIWWRPSWEFSLSSLRTMFSYGSRLLFSGLLDTVYSNIYLIIIGKLFSATDLGFYTRAQTTQQLPASTISSIVGRVTFPVFSSMQDDKVVLKRYVKKSLKTLALINFPLMIGLIVVAKPLVLVLLTAKWLPCVPYLQLLSTLGILYPLQVINLNLLMALGRSDLFFRLEIIKKILITIAVALTWRGGIIVMIYGQMVLSIISYYLNGYYTGKLLSYPVMEQVKDFIPSMCLASVMGILIYLIRYVRFPNDFFLLAVQIVAGIILYGFLCNFAKLSSFMELRFMLQSKYQLFHNRIVNS